MSYLLRKINKARWLITEDQEPWLPTAEAPGDLRIHDLLARRGDGLSLWEVDADTENLDQILAACAATRDHLDVFDYAILERSAVEDLGIRLEATKGTTLDDEANSWHVDAVELTAQKVARLAGSIQHRAERKRVPGRQVLQLVCSAVTENRFSVDSLKPGLQAKVSAAVAGL